MTHSTYCSWSTESPPAASRDAEEEFEIATRAARNELKRENERSDSEFYKALRYTAPGDLQAIANAQAIYAQALAVASGNYHNALANAERKRLCATSIKEAALTDSRVSSATLGPLSDLVKRLAMQQAAAFTARFFRVRRTNTNAANGADGKRPANLS